MLCQQAAYKKNFEPKNGTKSRKNSSTPQAPEKQRASKPITKESKTVFQFHQKIYSTQLEKNFLTEHYPPRYYKVTVSFLKRIKRVYQNINIPLLFLNAFALLSQISLSHLGRLY